MRMIHEERIAMQGHHEQGEGKDVDTEMLHRTVEHAKVWRINLWIAHEDDNVHCPLR